MIRESIHINDVNKIFSDINSNELSALKDINLEIKAGEFVSIVGSSGSGKSTLLRLVAGLDTPTSGSISIGKDKVNGSNSKVGMMFQEPTLLPWKSVIKNISFGVELKNEKTKEKEQLIEYLIEKVGLETFENSYPHELSGGMAQRVSLVRALSTEPEILLLDEPLGALDAFTRSKIQEEIVNIWLERKFTTVMVTHDIEEAVYFSNRIIVMSPRPGQIRSEVVVKLPYPRDRNSLEFFKYKEEVMKHLNY
ncbi:ABC transporter ATP-binding protein [Miniphocaeibacter massiliensis]|uniref:ABC transporter ATP-binding protein n=1 Tax=Miniphocaeibacter massiliensis TaxID=2041841 RepID=UPI000C1B97AD|nr:ABC transporter ATP-binding protein [Miniphocaeibacter massiliensis]